MRLHLVTGPLGGGKTTLLRRLLADAPPARFAVLVNELGDIGIDGAVLGAVPGLAGMTELTGGCLCCAVDLAEIEDALDALEAAAHPDAAVIEASGAAEPGVLLRRLAPLGRRVDTVVCCVPAGHLLDDAELHAQLSVADIAVVTHEDVVGPARALAFRTELASRHPRLLVVGARRGALDAMPVRALFGLDGGDVGTMPARPEAAPAGVGAALHVTTWTPPGPLDRHALLIALRGPAAGCLRVKGVVTAAGERLPVLVNAVRGRAELEWLALETPVRGLVLISTSGADHGPALAALHAAVRDVSVKHR